MSLKNAIRAAADEKAKQGNPREENTQSAEAVEPEDAASSLTIKVSRRQRLHWLIAARKEGTTLTQAITDALNARYGEAPKEN